MRHEETEAMRVLARRLLPILGDDSQPLGKRQSAGDLILRISEMYPGGLSAATHPDRPEDLMQPSA